MPRRCRYLARDWRAIGPIFVKGGRRHDKRASAMNATSPRPPRPTLWKRWEHGHVKPLLRRLKPWRQTCFGGIAVSFL
jgi:hypothetical protein